MKAKEVMELRIDIKGCIVPSNDAVIYEYFGIEHTCPRQVVNLLNKSSGETIDVYINSGGGDVFAGSEIYSALRERAANVKIHVVGLAASAASVIACAAHSDISPTAMLMVHNVSGGANGDYHVMEKHADVLKKANETIAAAYCEKCGISKAEALALMNSETWLTAEDAVKKGLIDEISAPGAISLVASASGMLPQSVIEKTRNMLNKNTVMQKEQAKLNLLKKRGCIDYV